MSKKTQVPKVSKEGQAQARIIRHHYRLTRPVTAQEVTAEVASLERRARAGSMDDMDEHLFAALRLEASYVGD